jgi:hypothetical protein
MTEPRAIVIVCDSLGVGELPEPMKRKIAEAEADPLHREIDFSNARPNPFARDFYKSRNVRILAPDLLDAFPDSESVNEALRTLVRVMDAISQKISARRVTAPKAAKKK